MHVLVVGDDLQAAGTIGQALQAEGFLAPLHHHVNLDETLDHLSKSRCDLIVLDCQRQGCTGACLLSQYRMSANTPQPSTPVLVLAAQPTITAQVTCLSTGANVFLAHPVQRRLLVAQVRALILRMMEGHAPSWPNPPADATERVPPNSCGNCSRRVLRVADLIFDPATRTAWRGTKMVKLPEREAELLELMMRHPGKLFSLKDLAAKVWGHPLKPKSNVVAVNISRLRKKLDIGFDLRLIHTVHGKGYKIEPPSLSR